MAETLFDHGLHAEDALFELYFMRAIHSVTQARKSLRSKVIPNDGRTYNVDLAASSGIMRDKQTLMLQNTI